MLKDNKKNHEELSLNPNLSLEKAPFGSLKSQNRKSKKKLLLIICSILVVILIAFTTVFLLSINNKITEKAVSKPTDTSLLDSVALSALGNSLKTSLKEAPNASALVYKSTDPLAVIKRINQDNLWVAVDDNSTILTFSSIRDNTSNNEADYNDVISQLATGGLNEVGTVSIYKSDVPTTRYFESDDTVCVLRTFPESKSYYLQVDCAKTTSFSQNIAALKPFTDIYLAGVSVSAQGVLLGKPDIRNSATKDYKNARFSTANLSDISNTSVAEFYQVPDKTWHFFKDTDNPDLINCSEYNSDDLIKAFVGFTCFDSSTKSSSYVQTENPTFDTEPGALGG